MLNTIFTIKLEMTKRGEKYEESEKLCLMSIATILTKTAVLSIGEKLTASLLVPLKGFTYIHQNHSHISGVKRTIKQSKLKIKIDVS